MGYEKIKTYSVNKRENRYFLLQTSSSFLFSLSSLFGVIIYIQEYYACVFLQKIVWFHMTKKQMGLGGLVLYWLDLKE